MADDDGSDCGSSWLPPDTETGDGCCGISGEVSLAFAPVAVSEDCESGSSDDGDVDFIAELNATRSPQVHFDLLPHDCKCLRQFETGIMRTHTADVCGYLANA